MPFFQKFMLFLPLWSFIACHPKLNIKERESSRPPNILFILADDQGWGDLSFNGNTNLSTPNIDALAANGASFDYFFVSPVCSPTRAEILTGRYHPRGGVYSTSAGGERLDLDEVTIADVLKKRGYQTAAYGKWHNGMQYPYHPNGRGFDEFYGFCSGHWGNYFSPMLEHNGQIVKGEGFIIDDFTNKAMEFMETHRENPFFVYLPYNTPHSPMQVPDEWWDRFAEKDLELRNRNPNDEDVVHTQAALAMCENIDWNVGRLMQKLEALELEEETIVIYLSDNGPNGWRWNGDMKGRKGSTDEGGVRSPLFIQWKDHIMPGTRIDKIAAAIDFLPTLADLTGIVPEIKNKIDGVSLKPLLLGQEMNWPDRVILSHWEDRTSVRSQKLRLDHEGQLFDMQNDPGQRTDISGERMDILKSLSEEKVKWENEVLSELPDVDERPFPVGHPDFAYTQIPARDGIGHGAVERSNRFPNCTFFTNWKTLDDSISWDIDVVATGDFKVTIYYTCPPNSVGSSFRIRSGIEHLEGKILKAHDPPLTGMEHDRGGKRQESYVKDFMPLEVGTLRMAKGSQKLSISAREIPGSQVMDFRLMMLERIL